MATSFRLNSVVFHEMRADGEEEEKEGVAAEGTGGVDVTMGETVEVQEGGAVHLEIADCPLPVTVEVETMTVTEMTIVATTVPLHPELPLVLVGGIFLGQMAMGTILPLMVQTGDHMVLPPVDMVPLPLVEVAVGTVDLLVPRAPHELVYLNLPIPFPRKVHQLIVVMVAHDLMAVGPLARLEVATEWARLLEKDTEGGHCPLVPLPQEETWAMDVVAPQIWVGHLRIIRETVLAISEVHLPAVVS